MTHVHDSDRKKQYTTFLIPTWQTNSSVFLSLSVKEVSEVANSNLVLAFVIYAYVVCVCSHV